MTNDQTTCINRSDEADFIRQTTHHRNFTTQTRSLFFLHKVNDSNVIFKLNVIGVKTVPERWAYGTIAERSSINESQAATSLLCFSSTASQDQLGGLLSHCLGILHLHVQEERRWEKRVAGAVDDEPSWNWPFCLLGVIGYFSASIFKIGKWNKVWNI